MKPEFALCGTCAPLLTIVIDESGRGGAPPPSSSSSNEAPPPPPPPPTRVSEATLYRNGVAGQGSLQQTRRWNRPVMLDVAAAPSSSSSSDSEDVRDVSVSLDLAAEDAIHLRVRRFEPVDGDVTARRWVDGDGTAREKQLAPFALASIWAAAYDFKDYLEAHCLSGPRRALGLVVPPPHPVVGKVYDQAGIHFKRLVVRKPPLLQTPTPHACMYPCVCCGKLTRRKRNSRRAQIAPCRSTWATSFCCGSPSVRPEHLPPIVSVKRTQPY